MLRVLKFRTLENEVHQIFICIWLSEKSWKCDCSFLSFSNRTVFLVYTSRQSKLERWGLIIFSWELKVVRWSWSTCSTTQSYVQAWNYRKSENADMKPPSSSLISILWSALLVKSITWRFQFQTAVTKTRVLREITLANVVRHSTLISNCHATDFPPPSLVMLRFAGNYKYQQQAKTSCTDSLSNMITDQNSGECQDMIIKLYANVVQTVRLTQAATKHDAFDANSLQ